MPRLHTRIGNTCSATRISSIDRIREAPERRALQLPKVVVIILVALMAAIHQTGLAVRVTEAVSTAQSLERGNCSRNKWGTEDGDLTEGNKKGNNQADSARISLDTHQSRELQTRTTTTSAGVITTAPTHAPLTLQMLRPSPRPASSASPSLPTVVNDARESAYWLPQVMAMEVASFAKLVSSVAPPRLLALVIPPRGWGPFDVRTPMILDRRDGSRPSRPLIQCCFARCGCSALRSK